MGRRGKGKRRKNIVYVSVQTEGMHWQAETATSQGTHLILLSNVNKSKEGKKSFDVLSC